MREHRCDWKNDPVQRRSQPHDQATLPFAGNPRKTPGRKPLALQFTAKGFQFGFNGKAAFLRRSGDGKNGDF